MPTSVISIKNLHKNFGNVKAVSDLNLEVNQSVVFGFLGQNPISVAPSGKF